MSSVTDKVMGAPDGALILLHDLDALAEVAALDKPFSLAIVGHPDLARGIPRGVTVFREATDVPADAVHIRKQGRPRTSDGDIR